MRAHVFATRVKPQYRGREQILRECVWPLLMKHGVERLVLDAEAGPSDRDRRVLSELTYDARNQDKFTYHHDATGSEPMLWVPDAIAWAYGKGGQWRRRAAELVVNGDEIDGL